MLSRRFFLLRLVPGAGALALWDGRVWSADGRRSLRVGLVLPRSGPLASFAAEAAYGAELGAEEARRTAELLGADFELLTAAAESPQDAAREAARLAEAGAMAIVGGLDASGRAAIAEIAERRQVLFLALGSAPDEPLRRYVFHLDSSLRHRLDALAGWLVQEKGLRRWRFVAPNGEDRQVLEMARRAWRDHGGEDLGEASKPDLVFLTFGGEELQRYLAASSRTGAPRIAGPFPPLGVDGSLSAVGKDGIWPVDWHPGLVRYGAEQLGQRFIARFGRPMSAAAWSGWAAVKALAELALRNPDLAREDLPARLEALRFDGHKGSRLAFDPGDHHLRQPVYLVGWKEPAAGFEVLAEVAPAED